MQALALTVLPVLLRTTLGLALASGVVELVLRVARPQTPHVHRIAWLVALAAGWAFVGWVVEVPWYPASAAAESGAAIEDPGLSIAPAEPMPLPRSSAARAVDTASAASGISPTPSEHESVSTSGDPPPMDAALSSAGDTEFTTAANLPSDALSPSVAQSSSWPLWLAGAWVAGILAAAGNWLVAYVRFIALVRRAHGAEVAVPSSWQAEWRRLLDKHNVRREIPLVATTNVGPSLCRLPRGYVILVPRETWGAMTSAMRQAVLRHELTHLLRGDVWWSLAARGLALPHWFNPAAWWCVRRFDEAAEWACDRAATSELPAAQFAALLVNMGGATQPHSFNPAARGRGLAMRVRRLLSDEPREDATMKKLIVLVSAALVLVTAVVRVELVAQEPATAPTVPEAPTVPAPAIAPRVEGSGRLSIDFAPAANDDESRELTKELVEVSQQGFKAAMLAFQSGKASLELLCDWSRRWVAAELELDSDPAKQVEHRRAHLTRMEKLHQHVEELHKAANQGGEAERLALTSYYVVQAKRDLAKAEQRAQRPHAVLNLAAPVNEPISATSRPPVPAAAPTPAPAPVPTPTAPALVPSPAAEPAVAPRPPILLPEPRLAPQPSPTRPEGVDDNAARFDGRTFAEWEKVLHQELSPSARTTAIQALTAFGVHDEGLAKVVAQLITGVMRKNRQRQLDNSPAGQLLTVALQAFVEIDRAASLPVLAAALQSEDPGEVRFALQVFVFGVDPPPESLPRLTELTKNANPEIRYDAVRTIARVDRWSPAIVAALADENAKVAHEAVLTIVPLERPHEFAYRPTPPEGAIEELIRLAADPKRNQALRVEAISALERLGAAAATALPTLQVLAQSPEAALGSWAQRAVAEIAKRVPPVKSAVPTPASPREASAPPATEPPQPHDEEPAERLPPSAAEPPDRATADARSVTTAQLLLMIDSAAPRIEPGIRAGLHWLVRHHRGDHWK